MDEKLDAALDQAEQAAKQVPSEIVVGIVAVLAAIVVLYAVVKLVRRFRRKPVAPPPDLTIDVLSLSPEGPPKTGPGLFFYNVPVRVAALVLAPAGRVRELPPDSELHSLLDGIVPGMAAVVAAHRPLVRRWPAQLSIRGFAHQLFSHAKLPGQGGKGTPWCSAAGVIRLQRQPVMVGMILRAAVPTNLGQRIIEEEGQWLGLFQIRELT